jgi:hypothetical protein
MWQRIFRIIVVAIMLAVIPLRRLMTERSLVQALVFRLGLVVVSGPARLVVRIFWHGSLQKALRLLQFGGDLIVLLPQIPVFVFRCDLHCTWFDDRRCASSFGILNRFEQQVIISFTLIQR